MTLLKRGGFLSRFESGSIASIVKMVINDPSLTANSIRTILKEHLPEGYEMSAMDCNNFRIWCKKQASKIDKEGPNVTFQPNEIRTAPDNWRNEKAPPSMEEAGETLREVLRAKLFDKNGAFQDRWEVEVFLQQIKSKCPGFDYRTKFHSHWFTN